MSKTRIKKSLVHLDTREAAETAMNELALTANNRRKFVARMDAQLLAIKEEFEPMLAACDDAIRERTDALQAWAEANPEAFGKRKSLEFATGILGFRTGTPKLALLSRAWTWELVLEKIQERAFQFVRTKEEVDKEAILAFHAGAPDKPEAEAKVLKPIGVQVKQDEGFFIEPKLSAADVG